MAQVRPLPVIGFVVLLAGGLGLWWWTQPAGSIAVTVDPAFVQGLQVTVNGGAPPERFGADDEFVLRLEFAQPKSLPADRDYAAFMFVRAVEPPLADVLESDNMVRAQAPGEPRHIKMARTKSGLVDISPPPQSATDPNWHYVGYTNSADWPEALRQCRVVELSVWVTEKSRAKAQSFQADSTAKPSVCVWLHELRRKDAG